MIEQFINELLISVSLFKPETALIVTFLVALVADLIFRKSRNIAGWVSIIGLIVTGIYLFGQCDVSQGTFSNLISIDPFASFFKWVILLSSFVIVLISFFSKELYRNDRKVGEYYLIIIGMTFGMFLLSGASNLLMIYLAIEVMSISSYILAGYTKEIKRSTEASLKYVIFGAVSSGVMLYGMSILFGLTGSMNLMEINAMIGSGSVNGTALLVSALMIIAGIGYKISAVPFHLWTPDVYEGAPVTITAYLSVASKAAGFAVLIRFLKLGFLDMSQAGESTWAMLSAIDWQYIIACMAVLSMTIGNLVALWQKNIKRMLAYSSIAHAGYMLMAVSVMNDVGVASVMIYFFMYMLMNIGAFMIVMFVSNRIDSDDMADYTGLAYRMPFLCGAMVVFLISLTGLPPTAGFIGKLFVFQAVLSADMYWLALIGILNSVVSLFYYAKVIRNMFLRNVDSNREKDLNAPIVVVLTLMLAVPTVLFGLFYEPIVAWAMDSVNIFIG